MIFYIFKCNYLKILSHVYNSHYISSREGSSRTEVGNCYIGLIFRIHYTDGGSGGDGGGVCMSVY